MPNAPGTCVGNRLIADAGFIFGLWFCSVYLCPVSAPVHPAGCMLGSERMRSPAVFFFVVCLLVGLRHSLIVYPMLVSTSQSCLGLQKAGALSMHHCLNPVFLFKDSFGYMGTLGSLSHDCGGGIGFAN